MHDRPLTTACSGRRSASPLMPSVRQRERKLHMPFFDHPWAHPLRQHRIWTSVCDDVKDEQDIQELSTQVAWERTEVIKALAHCARKYKSDRALAGLLTFLDQPDSQLYAMKHLGDLVQSTRLGLQTALGEGPASTVLLAKLLEIQQQGSAIFGPLAKALSTMLMELPCMQDPLQAIGKCTQCGRPLKVIASGVLSGGELESTLNAAPYTCASCCATFCVDCMREIKDEPCPLCAGAHGWDSGSRTTESSATSG